MAFKMKGPSLYQNGAFGKNLNVQKDYTGQADGRATSSPFQQKEGEKQKDKEKPKLNQFGETPEQYKKRMEEMGLRKPDKKAPPVKQLVPEPPPQIPQKIQPASPVQQTAKQAPPRKKAKTSFKNKAKAAWYTEMHHDGGKSSTAEKWKTYKGKKKEFRKAKKTGEDVSWKSGY